MDGQSKKRQPRFKQRGKVLPSKKFGKLKSLVRDQFD